MSKAFWISWYQPTEDYRPVYDPYKESEPFGHDYWCSGSSDDAWTMCALVHAESEQEAKASLLRYWPEAKDWRFCDLVEPGWRPSDRFPKQEVSPIL